MDNGLSERLTDVLIRNQFVKREEKALCVFGLHYAFMTLLNIATTAIVGGIMGMLWQSLVFLVCYIPLRSFAGGYHAKTQFRCYCASVCLVAVALLIIRYIPWSHVVCAFILTLAGGVIVIVAPAENKKKPLDDLEHKVYRKRARIIFLVECTVTLGMLRIDNFEVAGCITTAIGMLALMIIFA